MFIENTWFSKSKTRGASIVSILVSLAVIAIGMTGMMGLQVNAISDTRLNADMTLALFNAESMAERMYANTTSAQAGAYEHTTNTYKKGALNCEDVPCGGEDLAYYDVEQWQKTISPKLSNAFGEIASVTSDGKRWIIVVSWEPGAKSDSEIKPCNIERSEKKGTKGYTCVAVDVAL